MGRYYDKQGKPLTLFEWSDLFETASYKRVAFDTAAPGVEVSTIWLGVDHNWLGDGPPIIFETAVFTGGKCDVVDRYSTEAEAVAGHCEVLLRMKKATRKAAKQ